MTNVEKVLTWLEICGKNRDCSLICPYGDVSREYEDHLCSEDLMADALSLLKEQQKLIDDIMQRRANNGEFD